jgi:dephospho-CoA kinase
MNKKMKIISLTGGIGSGKSAVSRILQEMGAVIIDADKVAHAVIQPDTPGWREIVEVFGRDVLAADHCIDRKKLAARVFSDPQALAKLNQITHPKVNAAIRSAFEDERRKGTDVLVVEVQIIRGADWIPLTDEVWLVQAPHEVKLERLKQRGLSPDEALRRMASQTPLDEKAYPRVVTIDNSGSLADLRRQLEKLWRSIHNES